MIERAYIAAILLSVSGFVFCAIFLPFEKLAYRWTSARMMVAINTIALISFVIPLYFVVSIGDGSENAFCRMNLLVYRDSGGFDGFVCGVRERINMEYLSIIWLIGGIGFFLYYVWKYISLLCAVRKSMFSVQDDVWHGTFREIKDENRISDVRLVGCCNIATPCTIGVRKKYIVIPAYMIACFDAEEIRFILAHEWYHIRHRDLLRKLLVLLLNCLNWFNPLYYLLRKNLSEWTEAACDEEVTKNFTKGQKRKYCELMIKVLELEQSRYEGAFCSVGFVGSSMNSYKNRMIKILKRDGRNSKVGKMAVIAFAMLTMLCGNAVAKEADVPVNMLFSRNVAFVEEGQFEVVDAVDIPTEDSIK